MRTNDMVLLKKIIKAGADVNAMIGISQRTPFMRAILLRNFEVINYLLYADLVDPNVILDDKTNSLELAYIFAHDQHIQRILSITGKYQLTTLSFLRIFGRLRLSNFTFFKRLLSLIMKLNLKHLDPGVRIISKMAICGNDLLLVKYLHCLRVPLNVFFPSKRIPGLKFIHYAANRGHSEMIKVLLKAGEDVDAVTHLGHSALEIAFSSKNNILAAELVRRGATVFLPECIYTAIETNNLTLIDALVMSDTNINELILSF